MANDNIWIRCMLCGEGLKVTKYYPSADLAQLTEHKVSIETWLSTHLEERQAQEWHCSGDLEGIPGFEFTTDDPKTATGQMYIDGRAMWDASWSKKG